MGQAAGANAREPLACGCPMALIHMAELHWYEAKGIGRKEFKIKHLP